MEHTPYTLHLTTPHLFIGNWVARIVQLSPSNRPWITNPEVAEIEIRVRSMLANHPTLLSGHAVAFRYNQYRIFVYPQRPDPASPTTNTTESQNSIQNFLEITPLTVDISHTGTLQEQASHLISGGHSPAQCPTTLPGPTSVAPVQES